MRILYVPFWGVYSISGFLQGTACLSSDLQAILGMAFALASISLLSDGRGMKKEEGLTQMTNVITTLLIFSSIALFQKGKPMATEEATFGAGCFWCVEAVFERLPGVKSVEAG